MQANQGLIPPRFPCRSSCVRLGRLAYSVVQTHVCMAGICFYSHTRFPSSKFLLFDAPQSAPISLLPYCFNLLGTPNHLAMTRLVQCCPTSQLVRHASDCKNARKLTEHMQWYVLLCKGLLTEDRSLQPPQLQSESGNGNFLPQDSAPARGVQ